MYENSTEHYSGIISVELKLYQRTDLCEADAPPRCQARDVLTNKNTGDLLRRFVKFTKYKSRHQNTFFLLSHPGMLFWHFRASNIS